MAFLLSQSGHSHKSPGKHEARYKPVKWAERKDLLICLIEVLAAAMKKANPNGVFEASQEIKAIPQWKLKPDFPEAAPTCGKFHLVMLRCKKPKSSPSLYKAHCFATRSTFHFSKVGLLTIS